MNKKRALFFDFDGVLVDSFEISYNSNLKVSSVKSKKTYRELFHGNVYDGLKAAKIQPKGDYFAVYGPQLMELELAPGALDTLKKLYKHFRLVIVSSTPSGLIADFFRRHGTLKYFTKILGSDVHTSKIEKLKFALRRYELEPQDCLFVTDTLGDILEAAKCNIKSIGITGGFHFKNTLQKGRPCKIIDKLDQLPWAINSYFADANKK